jgi:hypothetical protein
MLILSHNTQDTQLLFWCRSVAAIMWNTKILRSGAGQAWALMLCLHRLYMHLDSIHTTTNQVYKMGNY